MDVKYVYPVMVLFNNADLWKIKEASECRYAVCVLDMDGFSEVIVSGYSADKKEYFMDIYEATADGSVEKIKTNILSNKDYAPAIPAVYKTDEITIENMADSMGDYLKSVHFNE